MILNPLGIIQSKLKPSIFIEHQRGRDLQNCDCSIDNLTLLKQFFIPPYEIFI